MLDAGFIEKASWVTSIVVAIYQGPNLIRWATNAVASRPKDRVVRSSNVVDGEVAAKLARRAKPVVQQAPAATAAVAATEPRRDYDTLVDEEMGVGTLKG